MVKLRNRYYCDYCPKSGGNAGCMKRHEKGCTNNPNRVCSMCAAAGISQRTITDLTAALLADCEYQLKPDAFDFEPAEPERLRELAMGCPACMLTAIRRCTDHVIVNFDWKSESHGFWEAVNISRELGGSYADEWTEGNAKATGTAG